MIVTHISSTQTGCIQDSTTFKATPHFWSDSRNAATGDTGPKGQPVGGEKPADCQAVQGRGRQQDAMQNCISRERDSAAGHRSITQALGPTPAWFVARISEGDFNDSPKIRKFSTVEDTFQA